MSQTSLLLEDAETLTASQSSSSSTFADNLTLPVHRWFRYSAGFSATWVREVIARHNNGSLSVLDPFAGSGTVVLAGESEGVTATGIESHPFVARIATAKLNWREDPRAFVSYAEGVLAAAREIEGTADGYPGLIRKCYPDPILSRLDALRNGWLNSADGGALSELIFIALTGVLRECSPVGTAQWQYVLPSKRKSRVREPFEAFGARVLMMAKDMDERSRAGADGRAGILRGDAREPGHVPDGSIDLVITSPPYANNYDYADATRLEMSFFRQIEGWGDLKKSVRPYLVRSCSQHAGPDLSSSASAIENPLLIPLGREFAEKVEELATVKMTRGGRKAYDAMITLYFLDLARVWIALRRACREGALVCFVVGDSAPYGVHIPVERWLGELALAAGFTSYSFEKLRDRNTKWENRKHRVPLHEGRLWVTA